MARKGAYQSQRTYATVLVLALRPLIPLGFPPILRLFGWMIGLAIVIPLCFLPDLFCKLRYTAGRREALREHYGKMKHPGRKLAKIVLIAIALIVANVALMFHLGFIHWA